MEQEAPIDFLSLSLYELQRWAAGLDEQGKAALLEAVNTPGEDGTASLDLDMEALDRFIADLKDDLKLKTQRNIFTVWPDSLRT